jgi:uncharacterized protein YjiS (DUF1127 family)
MTMIGSPQSYPITPAAVRRALVISAKRLGRFINRWIAAVIAHREQQANLVLLRSLSDRELRDIGLDRNQIGEGLAEAAKARNRMQQSERFW